MRCMQTRANSGKQRANTHMSMIECLLERAHTWPYTFMSSFIWPKHICSFPPNTYNTQRHSKHVRNLLRPFVNRVNENRWETNPTSSSGVCLLDTTASHVSQCIRSLDFKRRRTNTTTAAVAITTPTTRTVSNHLNWEMNDWIVNELNECVLVTQH